MDTLRFIDTPPRSRNERLAALMRRMKTCEEAGTGTDKVVQAVEEFQLPAPDFAATTTSQPGFTKTTLFAPRKLAQMDARGEDAGVLSARLPLLRVRVTNASMRQRFGIEEHNAGKASRIIAETLMAGLIEPFAADQGKKYASYLPFWA